MRHLAGRIGDAYEVEDLSLRHKRVQAVHDLLDARGVVPPMDVENIDIVSPQFLERRFKGDV